MRGRRRIPRSGRLLKCRADRGHSDGFEKEWSGNSFCGCFMSGEFEKLALKPALVAEGTAPLGRLRLLHLEDDPNDALLCEMELRKAGWDLESHVVSTRAEFSVRIWASNYDIVLADYSLQDGTGIEVVEMLRKLRRDIPVILVTGSIGEENVAEALRQGVADYVVKDRLFRLPIAVQRILAERSERREKKRLADERDRFFMLSSDLLCILDGQGRILQLNPAWQRTLGYDIESLVQKPLSEWLHAEDRDRFGEALKSLVAGAASLEFETRCVAADKSCRYLQWRASSMPRQALVYATARDITEKKVLEGQLLRAQRIESIGTLANGIAHDLNNVLTPIIMAVDILQEISKDARSQKLLSTVLSSAQHGAGMVKQILAFSKGVDGEKLTISVKHLVNQMRDFARDTFPRTIEIETRIEKDVWMVNGDSTQLHQVLLNLCVNARDAMAEGGKLVLELCNRELDEAYTRLHLDARPGPYVVMTVSDSGSGIPSHLVEKIFEPFFTTKETGKGTGLGLSTVLGIVKGHGGFLNVYSEPGKGSRFAVYLPAIPRETTPLADAQNSKLQPGNGESILVVDDESAFREITKSILERYNYRVISVKEGTEAIAFIKDHPGEVALAITDMMMPHLDGTATMRRLHHLDPSLQLIATSGMPVGESFQPLEDGTRVPFLQKPYPTARLLETVRGALKGVRAPELDRGKMAP